MIKQDTTGSPEGNMLPKLMAVYINLRLYLVPVAVADELDDLRAFKNRAAKAVERAERLIREYKT